MWNVHVESNETVVRFDVSSLFTYGPVAEAVFIYDRLWRMRHIYFTNLRCNYFSYRATSLS